jgi:hypothetical protein
MTERSAIPICWRSGISAHPAPSDPMRPCIGTGSTIPCLRLS